jgi:hypothetical protein
MADHIAAMLDIKCQITDSGKQLEEFHVAQAMVLSLPKTRFRDVIKIQLFDIEPGKLTTELVSTKLQAEANFCVQDKASGNTALFVQSKWGKAQGCGRGRGHGGGTSQGGTHSHDDQKHLCTPATDQTECWYCCKKGPYVLNCSKEEVK